MPVRRLNPTHVAHPPTMNPRESRNDTRCLSRQEDLTYVPNDVVITGIRPVTDQPWSMGNTSGLNIAIGHSFIRFAFFFNEVRSAIFCLQFPSIVFALVYPVM